MRLGGFIGFVVVAPNGVVIAADQDPPIGKALSTERKEYVEAVFGGRVMMSNPCRNPNLLADEKGELRANMVTMLTGAPIRDANGWPSALLGFHIRPDDEFTKILQVARFGVTGETYAFDRNGLLLSQSRFEKDLKRIGLLADQPDSESILSVEVRDPGVNLMAGERPTVGRSARPLTRMAAAAVRGEGGCDADGYRDYRGVPRVGAWQWLGDADFGVATEVDVVEAFQPEYVLRRYFWVLESLLIFCAVGNFVAIMYISRQQSALQKATLAARQLTQYTLEEKLGAPPKGQGWRISWRRRICLRGKAASSRSAARM
jgi:hypothetical protein